MNKNTMYIIAVAVVIVIVAVIAGAYILMNPGGGGGGGGGNTYVPSNATSLQFNVDETLSGVTTTYHVFANNTVSTETMLRIEIAGTPTLVYILDEGQQKCWGNATGSWIEEDFATQWAYWNPKYEGYVTNLANWTTGEKTYTATDGTAVRIYDIQVNPTLDASLFKAPT
jgi:hypothetical protein